MLYDSVEGRGGGDSDAPPTYVVRTIFTLRTLTHNNLVRPSNETFWPIKPTADYVGFAQRQVNIYTVNVSFVSLTQFSLWEYSRPGRNHDDSAAQKKSQSLRKVQNCQ